MGQRSKISGLPAEVRDELDQKLLGGSFSGYLGLQDWLRGKGYDISAAGVWRYGTQLEAKVAQLKASAERARALVEASPDSADHMAQATMRLLQDKLFTVLDSMGDVDPASVDLVQLSRAMAPLVRASIAGKLHADQVREKMAAADQQVAEAAGQGAFGDMTPEALAKIRAIYTGAVVGPG